MEGLFRVLGFLDPAGGALEWEVFLGSGKLLDSVFFWGVFEVEHCGSWVFAVSGLNQRRRPRYLRGFYFVQIITGTYFDPLILDQRRVLGIQRTLVLVKLEPLEQLEALVAQLRLRTGSFLDFRQHPGKISLI